MANADAQQFLFVFPMASGHLNPSLPIARELRRLGHNVHYVCAEQMRAAIEGTGATFHDEQEVQPELFEGRPKDTMEMADGLKKEYGLEGEPFMQAMFQLRNVMDEMRIPGLIRLLQELRPAAVIYCPICSLEAALAAKDQGIPHIGLNTIAGPGAWFHCLECIAEQMQMTVEELDQKMRDFEPNMEAYKRLQSKYSCFDGDGGLAKPFGRIEQNAHAAVTLFTTTEEFYDSTSPELQEAFARDGSQFVALGPLLDQAGAKRAAGHKSTHNETAADDSLSSAELIKRVAEARGAGRSVVLASMGTVITGDMDGCGWKGRNPGADGKLRGLSGKELCQGAWQGVFDAFGSDKEMAPLIVLSLGPQADALDGITPPANAICAPELPQVDLLKVGIDLFLTHGGQNSFMEALSTGTPLVVCPGFADQPVNAQKAVDMGVGLKVDRPDCDPGQERETVAAYRAEVKASLLAAFANSGLKASAAACGKSMQAAGGVPRAVEIVLAASKQGARNVTECGVSPRAVTCWLGCDLLGPYKHRGGDAAVGGA